MKVLIDTNVILDVLTKREPHVQLSSQFLRLCGAQSSRRELSVTGFITASQTTDIFYMLRRYGTDAQSAKDILKMLTDNVKVLDIINADVQNALNSEMTDYEDALLACCAKRQKADYIVTRNDKDFKKSEIPALTPSDFLEKFFKA